MAPNTKKVYAFRKGKKALVSVAIATLFAAGSLAVSNGVIVHADDVASTVTSSELEAAEKEYNEASEAYQVAQVESIVANESLEEDNLVLQIQSAQEEIERANEIVDSYAEKLSDDTDAVVDANTTVEDARNERDQAQETLDQAQESHASAEEFDAINESKEKIESLEAQDEGYGEVFKNIVTVTDTPEFDVTKTIGAQYNQDEGLVNDEDGDPLFYYLPYYYFETDDSSYPTLTDEDLKGSNWDAGGGLGLDSDIDPFKDRNQNESIVDSNRDIKYVNYTDLYGNSYSEQIVYYVPRYNYEKVFSVSETNHYLFSSKQYSLAFRDGEYVGGSSGDLKNIFISKDQGDTTNKTLEQYKENFSRVYPWC